MDKFENKKRAVKNATIVLVGLMGSGKSSVARSLAFRLHLDAIDTDALVESAAGMSIPEIFAGAGESEFRRLESEQLKAALNGSGVIATGGGIVTQSENRALLQDARAKGVLIVYLRASAAELAQRIRLQPGKRPLIDGEKILNLEQTQKRVEELLAQRAPLYESVASVVIDTGSLTPADVADQIAQLYSTKISQL